MAITKERKAELVAKFGGNDKNTGSVKVQIAILTDRINALTAHLKSHSHDGSSRRGLFTLVGQRRSLLSYLERTDYDGYVALIKELGLRK